MKTLKDVYIKVTEKNKKELESITKNSFTKNTYLEFIVDDTLPLEDTEEPKHKQKVSLSELKRLIDAIPTREEITRLKRQISAYKTNYDRAVKHSLIKEDELELLRAENERLNNINLTLKQTNNGLYDREDLLLKEKEELAEMYNELLLESEKKQNLLKNLYDYALKELDNEKENTNFLRKELIEMAEENERLKNKKWWQIWK